MPWLVFPWAPKGTFILTLSLHVGRKIDLLGFSRQIVKAHDQKDRKRNGAYEQINSSNVSGYKSSGYDEHYYFHRGAGAVKEQQQGQFAGNGREQNVLQQLVEDLIFIPR